jgi:hypothetical protein
MIGGAHSGSWGRISPSVEQGERQNDVGGLHATSPSTTLPYVLEAIHYNIALIDDKEIYGRVEQGPPQVKGGTETLWRGLHSTTIGSSTTYWST